MLVQQMMMFAFAGPSVLGQVAQNESTPAADTTETAEGQSTESGPATQVDPASNDDEAAQDSAPRTDPPPGESARPPAVTAQSGQADAPNSSATTNGNASAGAGMTANAPEATPAFSVAEKSGPAPINPRPLGEEELFDKHPVDHEAITFKPGTGVVFTSKDKRFSLGMRLRAQFRADVMTTKTGDADTEVSQVFGIPRARLVFKGHVWDEHITYKTEIAISPRDMGMMDGVPHNTPLFDWYTEITHLRDLSLRMGQYKLLYSRQRVVSSGDLEFVDRSLAQGEFHLDRDIGGHLFSEDLFGLGMLRYYTGFTINEGRDSWEVETTTDGTQASWQYLARVEVLPFGDFDDYSEVDFTRENNARLSLGVAYAHSENGTRERGYLGNEFTDGGTVDNENFTADAMFKWAGLTATGELYLRDGERGSAAPEVPGPDDIALVRKGIGGFAQVSYLIPRLPLGLGVRYSGLGPGWFDESETSLVENRELGGQVGWYIAGHNLKLQGDYFHMWSKQAETSGDQVRVQLQVAY